MVEVREGGPERGDLPAPCAHFVLGPPGDKPAFAFFDDRPNVAGPFPRAGQVFVEPDDPVTPAGELAAVEQEGVLGEQFTEIGVLRACAVQQGKVAVERRFCHGCPLLETSNPRPGLGDRADGPFRRVPQVSPVRTRLPPCRGDPQNGVVRTMLAVEWPTCAPRNRVTTNDPRLPEHKRGKPHRAVGSGDGAGEAEDDEFGGGRCTGRGFSGGDSGASGVAGCG